MEFFKLYIREEITTLFVILFVLILRWVTSRIIKQYGKNGEIIEHRASLVIKYVHALLYIIAIIVIFGVWGVKPQNLFLTFSSIFTVIGVALFAQWSMLSNVTAGMILFFSSPFKIGDTILIHDKDFPIEAKIEDIKGIYTFLRTPNGERISYPNSLLLQKGVTVIKTYGELDDFTD